VRRDPREVLTRAAPPPDLTLHYGEHADQVVDVRLPPRQAGPLVIFLHGGFWRAAYDRGHTGPLAAALAQGGHPVVQVEFRRVGQDGGGWPGTFDDVAAAVEAVPRLLRDRVDTAGPILAGHSAGGQLALLHAERAAGVLALAPVADLGYAYELGLGEGAVADLLGGGPAQAPDRYAAVDPVRRGPLATPTVIVHGDHDDRVPIEVSRRYARTAGPACRLVELPGVEHFGVIDPLSPAWPAVLAALKALIDAATKRRYNAHGS
jgi:acetyl esterase/lipase